MTQKWVITVFFLLLPLLVQGENTVADNRGFDAVAGEALWNKAFVDGKTGQERRCTGCHTRDPRQAGRHLKTRKPIEPMAPSVNPERLTDQRKITKWFKRNCKWTLGRECTHREQGDVLAYLRSL